MDDTPSLTHGLHALLGIFEKVVEQRHGEKAILCEAIRRKCGMNFLSSLRELQVIRCLTILRCMPLDLPGQSLRLKIERASWIESGESARYWVGN